ncbi:putative per-hexamer repeat protein 5 [Pistacia vera]|uniref:putative per-hexamer repeat protein 5 n=1 Tax=Pistacia vera TaxID=55513 RepID=UPI0012633ED8|nr:putative per-hexamer repeat protein 5 [Pistacia vera]
MYQGAEADMGDATADNKKIECAIDEFIQWLDGNQGRHNANALKYKLKSVISICNPNSAKMSGTYMGGGMDYNVPPGSGRGAWAGAGAGSGSGGWAGRGSGAWAGSGSCLRPETGGNFGKAMRLLWLGVRVCSKGADFLSGNPGGVLDWLTD